MNDLTFVTGNQKKVKELERILGVAVAHEKFDLPEIQSLDLSEVVAEKAKAAYTVLKRPVIVEDTALVFHALGRLPGTFIKWFAEELDYQGLCDLLTDKADRSATVMACIALCDGGEPQLFTGECKGSIALAPQAGDGFGFDCIFIPEGHERTWSQMDSVTKDAMSHRGKAARALANYLT